MSIATNLIINSNIDLLELTDILKSNKDIKNRSIDLCDKHARIFFDYKLENRIMSFFNLHKEKGKNFCGEEEIKDLKDGEWFTNLDLNNWGSSKEIMLFIAENFKSKNKVWIQENDCDGKWELIK